MPSVKLEELRDLLAGSLQAQLVQAEQAMVAKLGDTARLIGTWPDRLLVLQGEQFVCYRYQDGAVGAPLTEAKLPRLLNVQDEARELRQEMTEALLALQRGERDQFEEIVTNVAAVLRPEHLAG